MYALLITGPINGVPNLNSSVLVPYDSKDECIAEFNKQKSELIKANDSRECLDKRIIKDEEHIYFVEYINKNRSLFEIDGFRFKLEWCELLDKHNYPIDNI